MRWLAEIAETLFARCVATWVILAKDFYKNHGCKVRAAPTPHAVNVRNETEGKVIAMSHVTC
jgi:hypothetical protein